MTVSPSWRKFLLTLHITTSVGWLGVDLVQLALGAAGLAAAAELGAALPARERLDLVYAAGVSPRC